MGVKSQTDHPTISVIVPVYKVEKYLRECVDSILAQTYADFELILIDDGSPDRCGEICDEYAGQDERIRVLHQENQGLSGARNAGMDAATGDFLTFIDGDDIISRSFMQVMMASVDNQIDIVACKLQEFTDREAGDVSDLLLELPEAVRVSGAEACISVYEGNSAFTINACGKIFRSFLIKGHYFPVGRLHEDQALVPRLAYKANEVLVLEVPLYRYRSRNDSITRERFTLKRYDDIWAIDQCITFFQREGAKKILKAAFRKRKRLLATYSIYARRDGVEIPAEYRVGLLSALMYLRKKVQPMKYHYYLAQVSPKLAYIYEYEKKIVKLLKKKLQ